MNETTAKRIAHCIDIAVANVNVAGAGEPGYSFVQISRCANSVIRASGIPITCKGKITNHRIIKSMIPAIRFSVSTFRIP